ncbi:phage baseplate assembly protein V [Campylobacter pinnipediorum subsp. caledonicus]|uniref:Phage baseplate assembly protein V n=1 Tax=Campylobacter pinnipediorum subsp. caledonicus TaxID=1874362 RepID=A0A1S6U8Y2_9BACT|nr:phage baseplate assembly protein V [Campylobacter pinnipediorum]AQW87897.1 phage baseplate assembly protein V [Campylobacter pinnipediorum subsp. caledonicus]
MDFIEVGIISEVKDDRARVSIGSMVTDFLPVIQMANEFACGFVPTRVGEQVVVLPIRGSLNAGVVLRSIYQTAHEAPGVDTKEQLFVFEDGIKMSYNTASSTLTISSPKQINIKCVNVDLNAKNINATAQNTTLKSHSISFTGDMRLNGNLNVSGNITDIKGDLTGHSHSDSDGGTSLPR